MCSSPIGTLTEKDPTENTKYGQLDHIWLLTLVLKTLFNPLLMVCRKKSLILSGTCISFTQSGVIFDSEDIPV
jgi:hypothetical protein